MFRVERFAISYYKPVLHHMLYLSENLVAVQT